MRHNYFINTGVNWFYLYRYPVYAFLLSTQSSLKIISISNTYENISPNVFNNSTFRQKVRPFLITRPDILQLLDEGYITFSNLPAAIHTVNNNLPFLPSAAS